MTFDVWRGWKEGACVLRRRPGPADDGVGGGEATDEREDVWVCGDGAGCGGWPELARAGAIVGVPGGWS